MKRHATAVWQGSGKEGKGHLSTQSTVLSQTQYSYNSRFEEGPGTNPEELLAASHAGCFTMAVSVGLGQAGFTAEKLETQAVLTLDTDKLEVSAVELILKGTVPGIDEAKFIEIAEGSKKNCIISKALATSVTITLKASLA